MSQFSKFVLFGSSTLAAAYLVYRFLKRRNKEEVPVTYGGEVNGSDKDSEDDVIEKCSSEECLKEIDVSDPQAQSVKEWVDESIDEYYSKNPGPSCVDHIRQAIWDSLIDSDVRDKISAENVKCYVQDCLNGERPLSFHRDSSTEVLDAHSPEEDVDERSDVEKEIEWMCNYYFGVTYAEYQALEEERAKELNNRDQADKDRMAASSTQSPVLQQRGEISDDLVSEKCTRDSRGFEDKDDKAKKKNHRNGKNLKRE